MTLARIVAFFVLASAAVACGGAVTSTPRIRVARDLGCTAEQTSVQRISEYRWEVRGCGRVAIYRCTYPVRDCWREGDIQSEAGEQQPALVSNDAPR